MSQSTESFNDYDAFVKKFEAKKTTDDCYTPPPIYDAVLEYAANRFGFDPSVAVRPFYPGGDFETFHYPEGCVVVDNPPFSILAKIKRFYIERGISFFLFCPTLTAFSGTLTTQLTHIIANVSITYANGAKVNTSFVTNMGGDIIAESCPELYDTIKEIDDGLRAERTVTLPKYDYPDCILTSARLGWMSRHHTPLTIRRADCDHISRLDAMPKSGGIFGGGIILSERAAAERAAAERAATKWQLSEREVAIVKSLG